MNKNTNIINILHGDGLIKKWLNDQINTFFIQVWFEQEAFSTENYSSSRCLICTHHSFMVSLGKTKYGMSRSECYLQLLHDPSHPFTFINLDYVPELDHLSVFAIYGSTLQYFRTRTCCPTC